MAEDFVIVGTAGHIDHGKTTLVHALTGVETDRTKEEKDRGISIDIGFAPLVLPGGQRLGLVDVPGHERFIRNMLAGAGGVDFILLVIDAREGVMPQTREHLAILQMLGIAKGIVVLSKADLVDEEWLAFVEEEVRQELLESFLVDAPIVAVSAVTRRGLDQLLEQIGELLPQVERKPRQGALRLPIDRVFSVQGFGTVVTGTIWRGQVRTGDALDLLPSGERVRVRSIQVHGEMVEQAQAGQRAAVALAGLRGYAHRGMTLGETGTYTSTRLVDVHISLLASGDVALHHRQRVRVYSGTAEAFARVLMLAESEWAAGDGGYAQLLLEQEVVLEARDHFVIRSYSPMHTLGGGVVIEPHPQRLHRRHRAEIVEQLRRAESGTVEERIMDVLRTQPLVDNVALSVRLDVAAQDVLEALHQLRRAGQLMPLGEPPMWVPATSVEQWQTAALLTVQAYYEKNRFDLWLSRSVVAQTLRAAGAEGKLTEAVIQQLLASDVLIEERDRLRLAGYTLSLRPEEEQIRVALLKRLETQLFDPPSGLEFEAEWKGRDRVVKNLLHALEQEGLAIAIAPDQYLARVAIEKVESVLRTLQQTGGAFTVAQVRDALGTSRKWALTVLEYMDRQKKTRRSGDVRDYIGALEGVEEQ